MLASFPIYFLPRMTIDGLKFSLDDIEHGILRKNQRAPHKLWRQFRSSEIRNTLLIKEEDYRIHFALNCGALSCPPISAYNEKDIENQLFMAEQSFVSQEFHVNREKKLFQLRQSSRCTRKISRKTMSATQLIKGLRFTIKNTIGLLASVCALRQGT